MKHRIFIASHLPEDVKKALLDYQQKKLSNSCFRLVPEQALHLTLIFIGDVWDNDLFKVVQACESALKSFFPIRVELNKITFGPMPHNPRLVWAEGKDSEELSQLYQALEQELINKEIKFKIENRLFKPHITLARINKENCASLPSLSEIETKIEESFMINEISIIESELKRSGPKYTDLNTFPLKH